MTRRSTTCCSRPSTCTARTSTPNAVQVSTLLSIKTGACPEDCGYCPQSVALRHRARAREAAGRCRRWSRPRRPPRRAAPRASAWAPPGAARSRSSSSRSARWSRRSARSGLETCATLGMLTPAQARELKDAGLDYYNHNLDTSPEFYGEIITTRTYQDRLDTLQRVRDAGIKVCCGGIVGMGETAGDRVGAAAHAGHPAAASRERADQPAGAGRGHAAARPAGARSARFRAHHRGRAHAPCRGRTCGCRPAAAT